MTIAYITAAVLCLIVGSVLVAFHVREYRRLHQALQARGLPVGDLYVEGFDYGSRGCVPKIKVISKRLQVSGETFTQEEQALATRSLRLYYTGGVIAVPGFFTFAGLLVYSLQL